MNPLDPNETTGMNVLVVDDDEGSRRGLATTLRELGHTCMTARDGVEALEILHVAHVDVVVADWRMPRLSGLELCHEVRRRGGAYVYFVFVTALDDKTHLLEGMRAGADDYISKPVDFDELRARMIAARRVVGLHRALSARNRSLRRDSESNFKAARIDALTRVRNRLALNEDLGAFAHNALRYEQHYSAALCDIDHFKAYNDHYGHLAGDEVLRSIARVIGEELRKGDLLYRYGGEEFLVVFPQQTAQTARLAMERVRGAVTRAAIPHAPGESRPVLTISAGVAELRHQAGTSSEALLEDWLERADQALYRAKHAGRDRVEM